MSAKVAYDAGVLVAADRSSRNIWADHKVRLSLGISPIVTAPVLSQVVRSSQQVQLFRFLKGCKLVQFHPDDATTVGYLLAAAGTSDVVDAHLVLTASKQDALVLTSDPDDLEQLSAQLDKPVTVKAL